MPRRPTAETGDGVGRPRRARPGAAAAASPPEGAGSPAHGHEPLASPTRDAAAGEASDEPLRELARRRELALAGGGAERTARQHAQGKRTARERLELLFDPGTFTEIGLHVLPRQGDRELPADAVITGWGRVDGRLVFAFAQDFTVAGGSLGEMHARKILAVQEMALRAGAPLVGINDSGGARIQEGVDALDGFARIFRQHVAASGVIPQISVIAGPCAGGAVYAPALTDFIFMVQQTAYMYITGPDVVRAVLGQTLDHQQLGGGEIHAGRSGVCHFLLPDEASCLAAVRRLLSYLPANNLEDPPAAAPADPVDRLVPELRTVIPASPAAGYDVRRVIEHLVDAGSFFEVQSAWAPSAVIGLARLGGLAIGVVANQPRAIAGCLDIDSSDKIARFVRTCDAFNLPLVTLVDTPGYLPGPEQEYGGIIRHGAKVLYAYAEATVPKVSLVLRKAYGGAYIAMCSKGLGADLAAAWPGAEIAVMGAEGACNIIYRAEIQAAADPEAVRAARVAEYRAAFANPWVAAARQYVDAVLDPAESRRWLHAALEALRLKRQEVPSRKHGNLPV